MIKRNLKGFTLLELLVTVAIVGILASIAITQFDEYRKKGYDALAISSIVNARDVMEAVFIDNINRPVDRLFFYNTLGMDQDSCSIRYKGSASTACDFKQLFPALKIPEEVHLNISYISDGFGSGKNTGTIEACHCKGSKSRHADYTNNLAGFQHDIATGELITNLEWICSGVGNNCQ